MPRARLLPVLLLAGCLLALSAVPASAASSGERDMLAELNGFRASEGAPPVSPSRVLAAPARGQARRMVAGDDFTHSASVGARGFSRVGEAIAAQPRGSVGLRGLMAEWARSPSHRELLLDPSFRYAGVGAVKGRFQGRATTVWVIWVGQR